MKNILTILTISALCTLMGCKSNTVKPSNELSLQEQLMLTASSVDDSYTTLARSRILPLKKQIVNTEPLITPAAKLGQKIALDYSGPIYSLMQKIASMTDYRVKVIGKEPAIPVIVTIVNDETTMADTIKNAALQAGNKANIVVYPENKVLEIRYLA